MFAVFGIGLAVILGVMVGIMLLCYYVIVGILSLAGLSRERWCEGLTPDQVKDKDEWWSTLSRADRRAWNRRERRKARYVVLRKKLAEEVTRRQQAWYDAHGEFPPLMLTRIANEVWYEWGMPEWDDINTAPDRPPCAWSQGGVIDKHYPKPPPAWEPPANWQ